MDAKTSNFCLTKTWNDRKIVELWIELSYPKD